jgi:riboflavin kinase/FMN adenylyltransferase
VGAFVLPADGIYAGVAVLPDGVRRLAAVSIGTKPTFGNRERVLEAHLLDWNGPVDEYGWVIKVELARSLRGQVNYDGVEPLVAQIKRDCEAVRALEEDMELMG